MALGIMMKYKPSDSKNDYVQKMNARSKAIQERRMRINEKTGNKSNDNMLEKLLSMTAMGVVVSNLEKLFDKMESIGVDNQDLARKFLAKVDSKASKEQIDEILELMDKHIERFDLELFKAKQNAYEFNEIQTQKLEEEEKQQENQLRQNAIQEQEAGLKELEIVHI